MPDPTLRIVTYCEFGKISTLAAATLRRMGFTRAVALDGGMKAWREQRYPIESCAAALGQNVARLAAGGENTPPHSCTAASA